MADLGGKLPDGVMMEILSRVPPNSLIRFKCVSKSWYALMNDPKFNVSLKNRKVVLLKRFVMNDETGDDGVRFSFLKYPLVVAANDDTSIEVEDVHFPSLVEEFQYYSIHGHSHGLLCLVCEFKTIFLYNPVTRELRKLPPSILYILESGYYDRVKSLPSGIGFGYDQKSMDFKVVRIVKFVTPETDLPSRVEVYDLKKDEWREIETPFPWRVTLWWKAKFQLYYQGFYYWWAVREELGVSVLLWFDMSQDVFGQISLPESFDEVGLDISIKVLNESIVVLGRRVDQNGNEISWDVWEMVKLGGDVVSWSKLFNISPVSSLHTPLEFVGSNQLLIDTCKEACFGLREGQLISYNIYTQHFKKLSLEGVAVDGTFIDQGEVPDFYFQKYPEDNPLWGFFTWRWILTLGFDHMYTSTIFLGMLALLGVSLMACTYTTQIPLVKVARRWNFVQSGEAIRKLECSDILPRASVQDLGVILMGAGYEVFIKGPTLYAFKGLAGRFAPIGVHLAMILIMAGATLSATGSFRGSVTVPQGLNFVVGDVLNPSGFISKPTEAFNTEVHVNKFYMDYYDSGEVKQFHSDLSLFDLNGKEVMRKTISVNNPLRYGGFTIYQTDWGFSALQILKNDEGPFNLAVAPLKINGDKKLYGTFLPVSDGDSPDVKGISMLARDLQSIVLYDQEGKFVGVRRPSSKLPIDINGIKIEIVDAIGSTGLELKTDPGVPIVYAGFGALMLTTCVSYLSHSQIWAIQDGTVVIVGGKTNRAKIEFPEEMDRLLDRVPEILEPSHSELNTNDA